MNPKKRTLGMKLFVCLLAIGGLLPSCTDSTAAPDFTETPSLLRLSLSLAMPQTVTVESRSVTANEVTVSDVRVFQFAEDGSLKNNQKYENTAITPDTDTGLSKVTTGDTDFDDVTSRFYIVINTVDALATLPATPSSSSDEGKLLAYAHTESDITLAPQVMVYGPYSYTGTSGSGKTALQLLAKMQHIGARVDVSWTIPADVNLTITSASVENIPTRYYLYTQPAVSDLEYTASQDITLTAGGTGFTFYMPRNEKGTGSATTPQEKNIAAKGPSGSLAGCTCIVLKGTYKYNTADTDGIAVEYRFYPGSDMIGNYDIGRGKDYQLAITLSGANSADARVSLTDSNVFGIDDSDDVKHDIEF